MRHQLKILAVLLAAVSLLAACSAPPTTSSTLTAPSAIPTEGYGTTSVVPVSPATTAGNATATAPLTAIVASQLEIPWALVFLPDGSMMFTERPGRVRLIPAGGTLLPQPILALSDVAAVGEGGLLGLALHPSFAQNGYVYLYYTYQSGAGLKNHVVRYTMQGQALTSPQTILDGIPAGSIHHGGRLKFGPDGCLYITAGETGNPALSQDLNSLGGKILRVTDSGQIPPDNPFPGSPVYSYGHRNPEGLAWDSQGQLWATEHGQSAHDEVNLIQPGRNYGWPTITGTEAASGLVSPVLQSGNDTWAPSGLAFYQGALYWAGLAGQSLFRVQLGSQPPALEHFLRGRLGRLRDVEVGPDGLLYVLTSNRDGRGNPSARDDVIIMVNPARLQ